MRTISFFILVAAAQLASAQKDAKPTDSFTISGEVKNPVTIQFADLGKWSTQHISDVIITNHLGEKKSEAKGMKGVLLTDVLRAVALNAESPKVLSEYYFVCKANDGYAVVYSWNELFNTPTGNTTYIVTEKDGKTTAGLNDAIMMVSTGDLRTGRRHLKSLMSIEVRRAGR